MKLTFRKEDLVFAMKAVLNAVGSSPLPIISHALISTTNDPMAGLLGSGADDRIFLAATDLEIGVRAAITGRIIEGGSIALPARKLAAIIREMPDSDVHIQTASGARAVIECGSARFRLSGLPAEEFPPMIPDASEGMELIADGKPSQTCISIASTTLADMIRKTAYAASRDDVRHFMTGVHISLSNSDGAGIMKMAATDGKRLAVATAALGNCPAEEKRAIVPAKAVEHLRNMLTSPVAVKVQLDDNRIAFDVGDIALVSRLIDEEYPDYEKVIPTDNGIRLAIGTQTLLSIVKRVGVMANPRTPGLVMEMAGDVLKVTSSTPEFGEGYEETGVRKEGDDVTISLNANYLMDVLKATDEDEVVISMSDPLKPVLMKPAGDDSYLCVIMPMRL